ncbi:hypothetical protein BKA93DRAFT_795773 [Sparassis latifolia]
MRCSICFEGLCEEKCPMTTPCGHMYCIDCATYNFVEPGSFCAICRRPQTLDTLIRLYPDYGDDTEQRASSSKRGRNADMGREVIDACAAVLKSGDYGADALAPALSKSENLVETLSLSSLSHEASDVGRLLRSLTTMLNEIRSVGTRPISTRLALRVPTETARRGASAAAAG